MIENLSAANRRLLAIGLLLLSVLFIYFGLPHPYLTAVGDMSNEISVLEDKLERYRSVGAMRGELQKQVQALKSDSQVNARFLQQKTPALAAADLQRHLKLKVSETGAQLMSTQSLGNSQFGEFVAISVKAVMRGSSEDLHALFKQLEGQQPLLRIEKLSIQRTRTYSTVSSANAEKLIITFTITGYLWPQDNESQ